MFEYLPQAFRRATMAAPLIYSIALAAVGSIVAPQAHAALLRESPTACGVFAPRYLGSSDYQLRYSGACKDGLAHGQGSAVWTLVNAPANKVKWEGTFYQGVYLAELKGVVAARPIGRDILDSEDILFDLGNLPAQPGLPVAQLHVLATSSLTDYATPCKPRSLWVANASAAELGQEAQANTLLRAAVDKLKVQCGKVLEFAGKRGADKPSIEVRLLASDQVQTDKFGNLPAGAARAFVPLGGGELQQYSNQVASQQRQAQAQGQDQQERQATAQKLKAFFAEHQAGGWAALTDIAQNPFRYADRIVVTTATLDEVQTPTRALVQAVNRYDYAQALLEGTGIAQWQPGSRLLAVRVLGRADDGARKGLARLQLIGSEHCKETGCADWLRLPVALRDGQQP